MLLFKSFFDGHRGAVLSLAGNSQDNFFYSSGSEGLIVRWQIDMPNEGQVLLKLSGYVSCLAYDHQEKSIFAAVNHKGIYVINAESGTIIRFIDIPSASFGSVQLVGDNIIVTTKIGEILILKKASLKLINRISTGRQGFPQIAVDSSYFWYSDTVGLNKVMMDSVEEKEESIKLDEKIKAIGLMGNSLLTLTDKGLCRWDLSRSNRKREIIEANTRNFESITINAISSSIYVLLTTNIISAYQRRKKGFRLIEKTQIEHNGQINDLLWIENYKFVISAGADKKIGVWQLN